MAPGPSAFADVPETGGRRGLGTMKTHQDARFEILVDGKPRSYGDRKDIASVCSRAKDQAQLPSLGN
jgi:hypothetical protein